MDGDHETFGNRFRVVYDGPRSILVLTHCKSCSVEEVVLGIQPQKVLSVESWNILNAFGTPLDFQ
jgi:hypothetical protein